MPHFLHVCTSLEYLIPRQISSSFSIAAVLCRRGHCQRLCLAAACSCRPKSPSSPTSSTMPWNTSCKIAQQYGQVDWDSSSSFVRTACCCTACTACSFCHAMRPLLCCSSQLSHAATSTAASLAWSSVQDSELPSIYWPMIFRRQPIVCTKASIASLSSITCYCCLSTSTDFPADHIRPFSCTKSIIPQGLSTCSVNSTRGISMPTPSADALTIRPPDRRHVSSTSARLVSKLL
jgi:hypothetical protein